MLRRVRPLNLAQSRPYGYGVNGARLLSATSPSVARVLTKAPGAPSKENGVNGFERDLAKLLKEGGGSARPPPPAPARPPANGAARAVVRPAALADTEGIARCWAAAYQDQGPAELYS